jgi:hypothetical protein
VSPTTTTTYTVTGVNTNSCSSQTQFIQTVSPCTKLDELTNNTAIELYPNPAQTEIFITSRTNENLTIEIYNAIGSLIQVDTDVRNLNKGLYHIAIKSNNMLINTKKLIVN